jgi:hypothetical protein
MNFLLDNSLAVRHARALNEMVKPDHSFTHVVDKFGPATTDEEWIRALVSERGWIVLSGDYRAAANPHQLRAWRESGLTVFFLGEQWLKTPPLQQHSRLALILDDLIEHAQRARPGSGYSVSLSGKIKQVYP